MPIVFAGAGAHAPGIMGWTANAPKEQADRFHARYREMGAALRASRPDAIVAFTTEHWTNFFLNNFPAFCIGRAASYAGPHERDINIAQAKVPGAPALSAALIDACFASGFEVAFSDEMTLDHGTMVPLHFLTPEMNVPIVPVIVNALAPPLPRPERCYELGGVIGRALGLRPERVAVIATGGLSHRPGEPRAGEIDSDFDRAFLDAFCAADRQRLCAYTHDEAARAGFGAQEIRMWIALSGATPGWTGTVLAYEPVRQWSTGCSVVQLARLG